jgi:hypothetical protein
MNGLTEGRSMDDLIHHLTQQNELLTAILAELRQANAPPLGFTEAPTLYRIYANRSNNCLWYTVRNGEVFPIAHTALTGYLQDLKFEQVERRGKPVTKLMTYLKGDRPYCIESGSDSQFSKGLLMAIAQLTSVQLTQPITLMPQPGEDDAVLFCRVLINSEPVMASYDDQTNWRDIAQRAIQNLPSMKGEII